MSLLNFGFTQGKKGEDQCPKRSADGPAAVDEIQTKNKKYDTQRKRVFLPQWKTKWPWVAHDEVKGVMFCKTCRKYPSLADKSSPLFSGTSNFRVDPLKSHRRSREHETCELRLQHESKENATMELKNTPIGVYWARALRPWASEVAIPASPWLERLQEIFRALPVLWKEVKITGFWFPLKKPYMIEFLTGKSTQAVRWCTYCTVPKVKLLQLCLVNATFWRVTTFMHLPVYHSLISLDKIKMESSTKKIPATYCLHS